jgi:hypothetical protein
MTMRFAIRIAAVALSIAPAAAADRGRFPPTAFYPPPPLVRVYSWTGCYLGTQLGGAFADNKVNGQFAGFVVNQNDNATAVIVGRPSWLRPSVRAQLGYRRSDRGSVDAPYRQSGGKRDPRLANAGPF